MNPSFKRTRLAPTPSGYLHPGNVLSFSITAHLARKSGAKIFLRIDDLDRERLDKKYVQDIFDTLEFLGIPWDEGPRNMKEYEEEFSQVHRLPLYERALQGLKDSGNLFACTCSRTQVAQLSEDGSYPGTCRSKKLPFDIRDASWRLDTSASPGIGLIEWDKPASSRIPSALENFIVRKKDGLPAYQLTSVIDDIYFGVDLVVRGEDLRASSYAQVYLSSLLTENDFRKNTFFHHALLKNEKGEKLSKSGRDISIQNLRKQGKDPGEIFSLIARSLGKTNEIKNWSELATSFLRNE